MVWLDLGASGVQLDPFIELGEQYGVRVRGGRLVVHYQIGDEAIEALMRLFKHVLKGEESKERKELAQFTAEDLKLNGKGVE